MSDEDSDDSDIDIYSEELIMNPSKVQRHFRKIFDQAMASIDLPNDWQHGGFQRPAFSGVRRHGPATMIQLIYRTSTDEFKLNVDVTLGKACWILLAAFTPK